MQAEFLGRRTTWLKSLFLAALLSVGLGSGAYAYDYFFARALEIEIEEQVGRKVSVVDTLVKVWDYQDTDGYLRFDTTRFRCAVPTTQSEAIALLREIFDKREAGDRTPPLVHLFGAVTREPIWGPVKGGAEDGVTSEQIVIICERIEKPRERFFDEAF